VPTLVFRHIDHPRIEVTRVTVSHIPRVGETVSLQRGTFIVASVEYDLTSPDDADTVRILLATPGR
jgi:hypothetical protein